MDNELSEIFKELLLIADANPDKDINELIRDALVKNGLAEEAVEEAMGALVELEGINSSAQSLAEAREEGESRSKWLESQLSEMTSDMDDDDARKFCSDVAEQMDKRLKDIVDNVDQDA